MKSLKLLSCFSLFVFTFSFSFGQSWKWGRQGNNLTSLGYGDGSGVAVDASHNTIITGGIYDNGTFGFGSYVLSPEYEEMYLVKYDTNGNVLWAKQSLGTIGTNITSSGVVTDKKNNILVVGYFEDTVSFGPIKLMGQGENAFIVKYDSAGNVLWANQSINASKYCYGYGYSIACDKQGNVFITGEFTDTISFGGIHLYTNNSSTIFIVKYNSAGIVQWARQSNPSGYGVCDGSITDSYGSVYITGNIMNSFTLGVYHLSSAFYTPFIAKYDSNGNVKWAKQGICNIGSEINSSSSITIDNSDRLYLLGSFDSTIMFGPYKVYSKTSSLFLTKYDTNGSVIWAKQAHPLDNNNWFGYTLSSDKNNHIFLSGGGSGASINFKLYITPDTIKMLNSLNNTVSIIVEFDTSGKVLCNSIVTDCNDGNSGDGCQVGSDPSGNFVYLAGDLEYSAIFNKDTLGPGGNSTELPFVARWKPCIYNDGIQGMSPITPQNANVVLYPNPNNGLFNLTIRNYELGIKNVEIYNMLGEKVYAMDNAQLSVVNSPLSINLSSQPGGVYLYRVMDENEALLGSGKFIIEK